MANPRRYGPGGGPYQSPTWETEEQKREWINVELRRFDDRFNGGDTWALFLVIEFCARWGVALPKGWAARLTEALNRYQSAEVREFGEAFGIVRPKHWNQTAAREWHQKALPVFYWVQARMEEGAATPDVFVAAAGEFAISAKRAEEYFYAIRNDTYPARD